MFLLFFFYLSLTFSYKSFLFFFAILSSLSTSFILYIDWACFVWNKAFYTTYAIMFCILYQPWSTLVLFYMMGLVLIHDYLTLPAFHLYNFLPIHVLVIIKSYCLVNFGIVSHSFLLQDSHRRYQMLSSSILHIHI